MYDLIQKIIDKLNGTTFRHETRRTVPDTCWRHGWVQYFDRCPACDEEAEKYLADAVAHEYVEADQQRGDETEQPFPTAPRFQLHDD